MTARERRTLALVAAGALLYIAAVMLLLPPDRGTSETFFFKDAGASMALGQGLTTSYNFGNPVGESRIYAGYVPGLPLIYGIYGWIAGVSPEANTLFELLVNGAVVLLACGLLLPSVTNGRAWERLVLVALLLLALPARYLLLIQDRPDALGLAFALAALWPDHSRRPSLSCAAFLAGLALLVSFFSGLLAISGIAFAWSLAPRDRRLPFWSLVGYGAVFSALPVLAVGAVLLFGNPDYGERLTGFVSLGTGSFADLLAGDLHSWAAALLHGSEKFSYWIYASLPLLGLAGATVLLWLARAVLGLRMTALGLLYAWLIVLLSVALVPYNKCYAAATAGFLLPLLVRSLPAAVWRAASPRRLLLFCLGLLLSIKLVVEAPGLLAQAGMGASYQRIQDFLATQSFEDRNGDGAVWLAVDPVVYFLFKPLGHGILSPDHPIISAATTMAVLDYVVLAYGGGGDPLAPRRPDWWPQIADSLELVYRPVLPQYIELFGQRLSNSSYSWEVEIWRRR